MKIMNINLSNCTISLDSSILDVLVKLNTQNDLSRQILFVIDNDGKVIGSLTDGDIRRALISNRFTLESKIDDICNKNFERVQIINENEFIDLNYFRKKKIKNSTSTRC